MMTDPISLAFNVCDFPVDRAVERICKNDDAYMQSPDIVKAQTTLEDSPLERKGNTVRTV